MMLHGTVCTLLVLLVVVCVEGAARAPQLWLFTQYNLQTDSNVGVTKALIDRGVAVGYTGIVLADYKLTILQANIVTSNYRPNLQSVISYATSKNMSVVVGVWPFGYSDAIFQSVNTSLAEPVLHANASFTVSSNKLVPNPCCSGPADGGFEISSGNTFSKWSWQDARVVPDKTVFHSGTASAKIAAGSGNARVVINGYALTNWKMYHVQAYIKTSGFSGGIQIEILDGASGTQRNFNTLSVAATQDWTVVDFVFNSLSSTSISIYIGNWGGSSGTVWIDDVSIKEYPLFNVVQRQGAPFKVYDPTTRKQFTVGVDYNAFSDSTSYLNNYHVVPSVTLPTSTSLKNNQTVQIDYYGVIPAYDSQIGACLTHPDIKTYMSTNVAAVSDAVPAGTGFFLGYDEMRHMHSCELCKAAAATAGDLLAQHVTTSVSLFRNYVNKSGAKPNANAKLYYWSDMFDPNHNAVNNYYYVPTTLSGSWKTLPTDSIIFNWNLGSLGTSVDWFNSLSLKQIVAGYYDSGDGTGEGQTEATAVNGKANILGFMYTTWENDYTQLENYANSIKATWQPGPLN